MSFEDRLQRAIQRGQRQQSAREAEARARQLSEEELKRMHSSYRLRLSEHIESGVKKLANHFPGFRTETIYGEKGWGAACYRDDLRMHRGRRESDYSRMEMTIRPYSSYHVLDLVAKGTINNKEVFSRQYYERLDAVEESEFIERIDQWIVEYAERFAAKT